MNNYWLSLLVFLPLAGAIASLCCPTRRLTRIVALTTAILEFLLSLVVLNLFDPEAEGQFQLMEQTQWIPDLNIQYVLGVDGISILFLPTTALLGILAVLASWHHVTRLCGFFYAMLLALIGVTMGVFLALDTILFFLFWELTLPPIYFLISLWGNGSQRRTAAMKYTMYMMFGGVALLFAFILLARMAASESGTGQLVFSFPALLESAPYTSSQSLVFLLLVLGFAVKAPLFPFHTWLPTVSLESPAQLTALLVGLKLGVFGLLRYAFPLAPEAAASHAWLIGLLGAVTMVYAAFIAIRQSNLRRMLAYASISHVGLVVIGIAALNLQGIQGAVFQLLNFTLIASGLMFLSGFLLQRTGSTEMTDLGNLADGMPRMATVFFLLGFASIGIPGTSGFAAEILLLFSAFDFHFSFGLAALLTIVLGAFYLLDHARQVFWGPESQNRHAAYSDLKPDELLIVLPASLFVIILGLAPGLILDMTSNAAEYWLSLFR